MKSSFFTKLILIFVFISAFLLLIFSAKADSVTTDEGVHLFVGYTYLTKGDFRFDPEHPPLLKELAATSLVLRDDLKTSMDGFYDKAANFYYDSWQEARILSQDFLFNQGKNADDANKLIFFGRLPFIFLTLILGVAVYWWTKKLYGQIAGVFSAFLVLFLPSILAHGHLINTDLGLTLFIFAAVYFWTRFLESASRRTTWLYFILSGLFVGLALSSKFTAVFILPILFILGLLKIFIFNGLKNWLKMIGGFLGVIIFGFIIVWASYGFSIKVPPPPIDSLSANINLWTSFHVPGSFDKLFEKIRPIMFPADFYKGLFLVSRHGLGGHGSFLLGQTSNTGWWYYFPVAIFYKTPIPLFIFLILSIVFWRKLKAKESFDELTLVLTPVIFLLLSMVSKADLGVRHILPIFPFLAVLASRSINLIDFKSILRIITAYTLKIQSVHQLVKLFSISGFLLLILWYLYSSVASYPNYLAYFNELAGGPNGGYKILVDSNLDWGQDIFRIKKYLNEHQISDGYILYPWNGDQALEYYGINLKPFPWQDQTIKGHVVVSATYYQLADLHWLDKFPREQITPGVFIFDLK